MVGVRSLIRIEAAIIEEIAAHFPDFAELLVCVAVEGVELARVDERVVVVVHVVVVVGVRVQGCAQGQALEDGLDCKAVMRVGPFEGWRTRLTRGGVFWDDDELAHGRRVLVLFFWRRGLVELAVDGRAGLCARDGMEGYGWVVDLEAASGHGEENKCAGDEIRRDTNMNVRAYLSITYREPFAASSVEKPSSGGSRVAETLSCLWRRMGGMSAKEAGVEATSFWCSSGEMCFGSEERRVMGILQGTRRRREQDEEPISI